jgi:hypothetical protein
MPYNIGTNYFPYTKNVKHTCKLQHVLLPNYICCILQSYRNKYDSYMNNWAPWWILGGWEGKGLIHLQLPPLQTHSLSGIVPRKHLLKEISKHSRNRTQCICYIEPNRYTNSRRVTGCTERRRTSQKLELWWLSQDAQLKFLTTKDTQLCFRFFFSFSHTSTYSTVFYNVGEIIQTNKIALKFFKVCTL